MLPEIRPVVQAKAEHDGRADYLPEMG
jgi:hypothetical protein